MSSSAASATSAVNAATANAAMSTDARNALRQFLHSNNIKVSDEVFADESDAHKALAATKPWNEADPATGRIRPRFFTHVKLSVIALMKMMTHAKSGGTLEVMGIMLGKIQGSTLVIMDAAPLPVEGTETRVNAGQDGYEYMVDFFKLKDKVGRPEYNLGWYHSHPGYGCWLSGIDVDTQSHNQKYLEPYVAVVIDPLRSASAGKVEIGAFRTYHERASEDDIKRSIVQAQRDGTASKSAGGVIPSEKIEDFGAHASKYYSLPIEIFKSTSDETILDLLWSRYWAHTLSQSALINNQNYFSQRLADLSQRVDKARSQVLSGKLGKIEKQSDGLVQVGVSSGAGRVSDLKRVAIDSSETAGEMIHGCIAQVIKQIVFNPTVLTGEASAETVPGSLNNN
ncbi:Mov34-domain-containing protein [Ramicandelaber brevisporus]|nr:Mov34-domain-containing protein [Ramicandelaber brevisporus]